MACMNQVQLTIKLNLNILKKDRETIVQLKLSK